MKSMDRQEEMVKDFIHFHLVSLDIQHMYSYPPKSYSCSIIFYHKILLKYNTIKVVMAVIVIPILKIMLE